MSALHVTLVFDRTNVGHVGPAYTVVWEQCVATQRREARINPSFMLQRDPVFTETPKTTLQLMTE